MSKFYGIGIGPGDKELLTLKAVRVLGSIDVLILPEARKSKGSIAYEIAKEHINPEAEVIYAEFPMVNDGEVMNQAGAEAARLVENYARTGRSTAFITLGDPSIYSTYQYILENLSKEIEVETIPGITSFCAAAALLNKPLVTGEQILSIIPATAEEEMIRKAVEVSGGMAFMKVFNHSDKVVEVLRDQGLLAQSTLVKRCTMEDCSVERDVEAAVKREKQYLSIVVCRREK